MANKHEQVRKLLNKAAESAIHIKCLSILLLIGLPKWRNVPCRAEFLDKSAHEQAALGANWTSIHIIHVPDGGARVDFALHADSSERVYQ